MIDQGHDVMMVKRFMSIINGREVSIMIPELRMKGSLVKSIMVRLAIIVISICGMFVRLRPAP